MKKRGRVLILLITAALAIEPVQLVYAGPAVDNLTGTVSQETGAEIRDENPVVGKINILPRSIPGKELFGQKKRAPAALLREKGREDRAV